VRTAAALVSLVILTACASGGTQKARVASQDDLSAIQAVQRTARNGKNGVPVNVLFVSGTITNTSSSAMSCSATSFILVDPNGKAVTPSEQWCDVPSISPKQSAFFNATFAPTTTDSVQLRYVHPDGSYEVHDLIIPPA
jgi:hypothetical protein